MIRRIFKIIESNLILLNIIIAVAIIHSKKKMIKKLRILVSYKKTVNSFLS